MSTLKPNTTLQGGKYKIVRFISAGGSVALINKLL